MCQKIARVACIQTAGELGALLRESYLIKKLQPLYNRQLRRHTKITTLRKIQVEDGYNTVKLDTLDHISADEVPELLGVFRSKKQAKDFLLEMARKYSLCPRLLGLENAAGACFAHKLKLCKGACINAEDPKIYNLRFVMAAASHQFKNWQHEGPIEISEKNDASELSEKFILDKWCILKNKITQHESPEEDADFHLGTDYEFDVDTYKILVRYLENNGYRPLNEEMSSSL
jgi:DNA polymerase-3 subunit epsilon